METSYYYYSSSSSKCSSCKCCKPRPIESPFTNAIDCCCCNFLHQQFTLRETFTNLEDNPLVIYKASLFNVLSVNNNGNNFIFPRGTIIARNLSSTAFTMKIIGGEEDETVIVPPSAEVGFTSNSIRSISVFVDTIPPNPIRALFNVDIFLPTDPV